MRIKVGDTVQVRTGEDKFLPKSRTRKRARVLSVDVEAGKLTVEGVGEVKKHIRRSKRNPSGGRLTKEMPIPAANVQVVCPSCQKPTRVGAIIDDEGTKHRVCKKCGFKIDIIGVKGKHKN